MVLFFHPYCPITLANPIHAPPKLMSSLLSVAEAASWSLPSASPLDEREL